MVVRLKEGNSVSRDLSVGLDSFLQDFAQMYGGISYTDIINLGKSWKDMSQEDKSAITKTVRSIKRLAKDAPELDYYELSEEDSEFKNLCDQLVKAIKGRRASLSEGVSDYKIKTISMDVAVRGGSEVSGTDSRGDLYRDISDVLSKHGYEMAGDFLDVEDGLTNVYVDNGYQFFSEE